jgi:hypothetical protein
VVRAVAPRDATVCMRLGTAYAARLLPLLLLALPGTVQAQFDYVTNNGMITITKYSGSRGAVAIPRTINGLPVTSIANNAFSFIVIGNMPVFVADKLTSVTIPNSVISIGDRAFLRCSRMTNLTIGNNVTSIGNDTFRECTGLTNLTIPDSVTSIGAEAFAFCDSIGKPPALPEDSPGLTVPGIVRAVGSAATSSPSPQPSPSGRGGAVPCVAMAWALGDCAAWRWQFPLPGGEGQGEGEDGSSPLRGGGMARRGGPGGFEPTCLGQASGSAGGR